MKITSHNPGQFADAIQSLLPPGAAWDWPVDGFGRALLLGVAHELARVEFETQAVLDAAIERHRPKASSWHISQYRRVADEALFDVEESVRRPFAVGSTVGQRLWSHYVVMRERPFSVGSKIGDLLWSHAAAGATFPVDLVRVDHLIGPLRVGSCVGDRCWGTRSRYVLRVRYYRSVVDPQVLWEALMDFKQAHVFLWFEDITTIGGEVSYA